MNTALSASMTGPAQQAWTLPIEGMTCASCVARVERSLKAVAGVIDATVNLTTESATVMAAPDIELPVLSKAVEKAGYTVGETSFDLDVEGMTCASCVARVEKALKSVPGVREAEVNLATESASVRTVVGVDIAALSAAVAKAGYAAKARDYRANEASPTAAKRHLPDWWTIAAAALLTLPLVMPMIGMLFGLRCSFGWARGFTAPPGKH